MVEFLFWENIKENCNFLESALEFPFWENIKKFKIFLIKCVRSSVLREYIKVSKIFVCWDFRYRANIRNFLIFYGVYHNSSLPTTLNMTLISMASTLLVLTCFIQVAVNFHVLCRSRRLAWLPSTIIQNGTFVYDFRFILILKCTVGAFIVSLINWMKCVIL